jgi:hypothetical protein
VPFLTIADQTVDISPDFPAKEEDYYRSNHLLDHALVSKGIQNIVTCFKKAAPIGTNCSGVAVNP